MNKHVKLVSILQMVFGFVTLTFAILLFRSFSALDLSFSYLLRDRTAFHDHAVNGYIVAGVVALFALLQIFGGGALWERRSWGRRVMLAVGVVEQLGIPVGTALGIYTLWVLLDAPKPAVPTV